MSLFTANIKDILLFTKTCIHVIYHYRDLEYYVIPRRGTARCIMSSVGNQRDYSAIKWSCNSHCYTIHNPCRYKRTRFAAPASWRSPPERLAHFPRAVPSSLSPCFLYSSTPSGQFVICDRDHWSRETPQRETSQWF